VPPDPGLLFLTGEWDRTTGLSSYLKKLITWWSMHYLTIEGIIFVRPQALEAKIAGHPAARGSVAPPCRTGTGGS
jgi:hypothetical protein